MPPISVAIPPLHTRLVVGRGIVVALSIFLHKGRVLGAECRGPQTRNQISRQEKMAYLSTVPRYTYKFGKIKKKAQRNHRDVREGGKIALLVAVACQGLEEE